jgi:signal transduction histidine kinase
MSSSADVELDPATAPGRASTWLRAFANAQDRALIVLETDGARLAAGERALEACATVLGSPGADVAAVLAALAARDPAIGDALEALEASGTAFDHAVRGPGGAVVVSGRTAGALAMVTLSPRDDLPTGPAPEPSALAAVLDSWPGSALFLGPDLRPVLANRAWLETIGAASPGEARARGAVADPSAFELAAEALAAGAPIERVRWMGPGSARRAQRLRAAPMKDGGAMVWAWDATAAEGASEALAAQAAAQALILDAAADAVAVFGPDQRLIRHNAAFARLWDLEPAWLAEGPTHGAWLDRLRQRRRLADIPDPARFRAEELARHERLDAGPEAIWRVAGDRTVRVRGLPHPGGGLILMFSDITPELRLKARFNELVQVRQATLDTLTDAVAVFGADARLKLRNAAFQRLWAIPPDVLSGEPAFEDIVDHCLARLADLRFWRALKGRVTDPDPIARAAAQGEARAVDGRWLAWRSRPLSDGATLISFADITDARRLRTALAEREAALGLAERLKREFVSSVSLELRTPLTTILGYAELLATEALPGQARGWIGAVGAAAADLARSVEDILTLAEIDAGDLTLDRRETDIAALLANAAGRWSDLARAEDVMLATVADAAPGSAWIDGPRIARALDHLVSHALRQTPAGGRVTLSARRGAGELRLEVADTGAGIPFHMQPHVFDRFGGEATAGSGVGMALVKALVELHGGWVSVESVPGAGAAFACHLPDGGRPFSPSGSDA